MKNLIMQLMSGSAEQTAKDEAEYQRLMGNVRSGKGLVDDEAYRLSSLMQKRHGVQPQGQPRTAPVPKNSTPKTAPKPTAPIPTHIQERGSLPRVLTNPYSLIGDAMRQKGKQ